MRILMISTDRTLLTAGSGDAFERHLEYAKRIGRLDIIVFSKKGFNKRSQDCLSVYPTNSKTKLYYIFDVFKIAKNIYQPKFDLIVAQDPFLTSLVGWILKKRFEAPLLIHFHGDFWDNRRWLRKPKKWWHWLWYNWTLYFLSRILVNRADGIRAVSSGIKDKLVQKGINRNKIRIIPTPIDLGKFSQFSPDKVEKLKKEHQNKKTIINVGLRDPSVKDYPTLFKTIDLVYRNYRDLAFCQIGAGFHLNEKIKGDKNLILTSLNEISQEELVNYYHASDIYLSSSLSESFGKVLIEAMAAGLSVVATATTGSKEIVQDGINGFLVPIGDSKALAEKILYLLNNPDIAKQMGEKGRQMVRERFNREITIKKIIDFWEDIINKRC